MPIFIGYILNAGWFRLLARVILTFVFWSAGLVGVFAFPEKVSEMQSVGLAPAGLFAVAVTIVQLGGAALIILNRFAWLGAGALGVFLLLTIPIVHPFWQMQDPQRTASFYTVMEHISLMGGLMLAAALSGRKVER